MRCDRDPNDLRVRGRDHDRVPLFLQQELSSLLLRDRVLPKRFEYWSKLIDLKRYLIYLEYQLL